MSIAKLMAGAAGVAVLAAAAATLAQPAKTLPAATTQHIAAARRIAGTDLPQTTIGELFNILRMGNLVDGSLLPVNPATAGPLGQGTYPPLGPVKVFDNLYVVGSTFVDAWILVTSDGIIQFDAMNNENDAKTIIEPAYAKLGLDPKKIKYIVLTHGHFDHFGGAPYFQKKYGVKVISSREDWDLMKRTGAARPGVPPPAMDMVATDGEALKLGDTTVRLYITPGHTRGPISSLIPVTDHGQRHMMAMFGGFGLPMSVGANENASGLTIYAAQMKRFAKIAADAGADGVLSTHPGFDGSEANLVRLAKRGPNDPNPYVIGKARVARLWNEVDEIRQAVQAIIVSTPAKPGGGDD